MEQQPDGRWRIAALDVAEQVLRKRDAVRQAGFNADLVHQMPKKVRPPILFLEGKQHRRMRTNTARFFTPRATEGYRALMTGYADDIMADFRRRGEADLSRMTLRMAAHVASHIVGLTEGDIDGLERRLDATIVREPASGRRLRTLAQRVLGQTRLLNLYWRDIRPAVAARRRTPKADLISHLVELDYGPLEMLAECLMYGVAGMVTTREFISACMWHFHEDPELRTQFVDGDEDQRRRVLYEVLRLEPIVGNLHRRASEDIRISTDDGHVDIPAGAHLEVDVYAINADERVVGETPDQTCPDRDLGAHRQPIYSFGAGHHRCPGEFVAIQESEIFLSKLLAIESLRVERAPTLSINPAIEAYELRDFRLRC